MQGELDALGGDALEGRLRELDELPALVEAYLRDLPDMVGRRRAVRGHETVPGENPLVPYRLTAERVRRKTEEEAEAERLAAENERAHRLRRVYEAIGLAVTARKDGTLLLQWSLGERALPGVTGSESPVLGRVFVPDAPR